jgi:UDP-N-acetylglucosamine 3-dehydrogenase
MRVAILGAGFMGSTHGRAFATMPGVEIAGIYGLTESRVGPLAAELKTAPTTDLHRFIDDPTVDAIDVCLPGAQHREVTEAAIAAGKHVLLEKPITLTMEDADALVDLAERSDRVFMIAHVLRFWPEYMEIARRVHSGDYGQVRSALAYRRQAFPAWSQLFSRSDLTGGAVLDQMIHDYDVLNWIVGAPRAVSGRGIENPVSGGYDQVQIAIDYGHASALVDGGMMMPESYPFTSSLHVLCERGAFEYSFRAGGRSVEEGGGVNELIYYPDTGEPERLSLPPDDPYAAEIRYFAECAQTGTTAVRATPADARTALKVGLAARTAVASGTLESVAIEND